LKVVGTDRVPSWERSVAIRFAVSASGWDGILWDRKTVDPNPGRIYPVKRRDMNRLRMRIAFEPLSQIRKVLSPIEVAVGQMKASVQWATDDLVEVRK
jgi:hypothetical protein